MCASCWSLSRMCITMHGTENVKFKILPLQNIGKLKSPAGLEFIF